MLGIEGERPNILLSLYRPMVVCAALCRPICDDVCVLSYGGQYKQGMRPTLLLFAEGQKTPGEAIRYTHTLTWKQLCWRLKCVRVA